MGVAREHKFVKLIVGMISADHGLFGWAEQVLAQKFGFIDLQTEILPFTHTNYYDDELGTSLWRKFVSFDKLVPADSLGEIKTLTNDLECHWSHRRADKVARRINLDPGYLTEAKLVLATTKDNAHRIYLGKGIFAEVTLAYREGDFRPFAWTYPDYQTVEYISFFRRVREKYVSELR